MEATVNSIKNRLKCKKNNNEVESFILSEYVENGYLWSKSLERLGANAVVKDSEAEIGSAFIKFSIVTKELSSLMKTLVLKFS